MLQGRHNSANIEDLLTVWGIVGRCWAEAELNDAKRAARVSASTHLVTCRRDRMQSPPLRPITAIQCLVSLKPSNANFLHAPPPIPLYWIFKPRFTPHPTTRNFLIFNIGSDSALATFTTRTYSRISVCGASAGRERQSARSLTAIVASCFPSKC